MWFWWWQQVIVPILLVLFLVGACFAVVALWKELTGSRIAGLVLVFVVATYPNLMVASMGGFEYLVFSLLPWIILFLCRRMNRSGFFLIAGLSAVALAFTPAKFGYLMRDGLHLYPSDMMADKIVGSLRHLVFFLPLMLIAAYLLMRQEKKRGVSDEVAPNIAYMGSTNAPAFAQYLQQPFRLKRRDLQIEPIHWTILLVLVLVGLLASLFF